MSALRRAPILSLTAGLVGLAACGDAADEGPVYVGSPECATCHAAETEAWAGSHHDLAMQDASEASVLGDFENATITYAGVTSTFFRRGDEFFVKTDGADGELVEFRIGYTFGVEPLQQYLIEFPGGRLQTLGLAWDARAAAEGGQRWFHVYEDEEPIEAGDAFHWTGPNQTWNYMCAACHSTDLRRNYDRDADAYETVWSEIDVSCEACHGPGSEHVSGAEAEWGQNATYGLVQTLRETPNAWVFDPGESIARRASPRTTSAQLDTCARCHARRQTIAADYTPGDPFLDGHQPRLLDPQLYFADGQILDEVYVYGSFLQSRMHAAGVTCSDCHDPHSLELRAEGNALCGRCHLASTFDAPTHHFHQAGSPGAACVACHMQARTYMVVDDRRDHSFRVPRPDLAGPLGTPEPCTGCHAGQTSDWAAGVIAERLQPERLSERFANPHYGQVLAAGRLGFPSSDLALAELAADREQPDIVRSTAVDLLGGFGSRVALDAVVTALDDPDPLVRMSAVGSLEALDPEQRTPLAFHLLDDERRVVRLAAARALADAPVDRMTTTQRVKLEGAIQEYIDAQYTNAERPESHMNVGVIEARRGRLDAAAAAYREAIQMAPWFIPGYVNLADVHRRRGEDGEGEALLRRALEQEPEDAAVHHALGLALVRGGRTDEALASLARASALEPFSAQFAYVHALALNSAGRSEEAVRALGESLSRNPYDRRTLLTLATLHRDRGELAAAREVALRAAELWPGDPAARQLLQELDATLP